MFNSKCTFGFNLKRTNHRYGMLTANKRRKTKLSWEDQALDAFLPSSTANGRQKHKLRGTTGAQPRWRRKGQIWVTKTKENRGEVKRCVMKTVTAKGLFLERR